MRNFNLLTLWKAVSSPFAMTTQSFTELIRWKAFNSPDVSSTQVPLTWLAEKKSNHTPDTLRNSSLIFRTDFADFTHMTAREPVNSHIWLSSNSFSWRSPNVGFAHLGLWNAVHSSFALSTQSFTHLTLKEAVKYPYRSQYAELHSSEKQYSPHVLSMYM